MNKAKRKPQPALDSGRGGGCRDGNLQRWPRGGLILVCRISDSPGKGVAEDLPFSLTAEPLGPDSRGRELSTHTLSPTRSSVLPNGGSQLVF